MSSRDSPIDFEGLAHVLKALAYPTRLEILDAIHFPRAVTEIKVSPNETGESENPDRLASRQAVQLHLDRLVAAGFVTEERNAGRRTYAVNPQKLYAITEELRRLSVRHAGYGVGMDGTTTLDQAPAKRVPPPAGPHLVLTHGVGEGKVFMLDPKFQVAGAWRIGRRENAAVSLDYDPFVSAENSLVRQEASGAFTIEDVPGSRNGTRVNWSELADGEARTLRAGDIIGVGRSLLVFVDR